MSTSKVSSSATRLPHAERLQGRGVQAAASSGAMMSWALLLMAWGVYFALSLLLPCRLEHTATRLDCDVLLVTGTTLKTPLDTFAVSEETHHSEDEADPSVAAAE